MKKLITKFLRDDVHLNELLHKGATSFVARVGGAGVTFLLYMYLARTLGAHSYGLFMLAFTIVNVLNVVSRMGLDNVLIRYIASSVENDKYAEAKGYLVVGLSISLLTGLIFTLILLNYSEWLSLNVLSKPELSITLNDMVWLLVPLSLSYLLGEALKGLRNVGQAAILQVIAIPGLSIMLMVIFSQWKHLTVESAAKIYVFSGLLTLMLGMKYWYHATPKSRVIYPAVLDILRSGIPLLFVTSGMMVMSWSDTVILGIYESSSNVGIYNAASRTAMLTSLILFAVNAIAAPKIAAMYENEKIEELSRLARQSSLVMTITVLPISVFLVICSDWVLELFGEEFVSGSSSLSILVAGQFVNVACGSVGYLLSMTGNEKVMRNIIAFTTLLNILLNIVLVQWLGMIGVAIATATSVVVWNSLMTISVRSRLGFWLIPYLPKRSEG